MHTIVPIQRFFSKLKPVEREAPEWHRFNPYLSLYTLSWDDILRHRCVLLLAPGNSGKTTEMKEQVKLLSEQGKAAFFIELKHLAKDDNQLLLKEHPNAFARFLESPLPSSHAWFFLDSADELKLTENNLRCAISNFCYQLGSALKRCSVVISCRGLEFNDDDVTVLHEFFFNPESISNLIEVISDEKYLQTFESAAYPHLPWILRVGMQTLSRDDVRTFVQARNKAITECFMADLDRLQALDWVTAPFELDALINLYVRNNRLGNRVELMEELVQRSTDDDRPKAKLLAKEEVLKSVRRLALAVVQTRTNLISFARPAADAFPAKEVLDNRAPNDVAKLLKLKLFLPTTTNETVAFRHREQMEFLAAQAIEGFSTQRSNRRAKRAWCLTHVRNQNVVPKSRQRMVGWLASLDTELRQELIKSAPTILIEHAKLELFGDCEKRRLTKSVVDSYRSEIDLPIFRNQTQMQRLHCATLVSDLVGFWNSSPESPHVRAFILALARWNSTLEFVPVFDQLLASVTASKAEKLIAVEGLASHQQFDNLRIALQSELDREEQATGDIVLEALIHLVAEQLPFELLARSLPIIHSSDASEILRREFELQLAQSNNNHLAITLIKWVSEQAWLTRKPWEESAAFNCAVPHYCSFVIPSISIYLVRNNSPSPDSLRAILICVLFCDRPRQKYIENIFKTFEALTYEAINLIASLVSEYCGHQEINEFYSILDRFRISSAITTDFSEKAITDTKQLHIVRRLSVLIIASAAQDRASLRTRLLSLCSDDAELSSYVISRTEAIKIDDSPQNIAQQVRDQARKTKRALERIDQIATRQRFRSSLIADPAKQFSPACVKDTVEHLRIWLTKQNQADREQSARELIGRYFGLVVLSKFDHYLKNYWRASSESDADEMLMQMSLGWPTASPKSAAEVREFVDRACRYGHHQLIKQVYERTQYRTALCEAYLANLRDELANPNRNWHWLMSAVSLGLREIEIEIANYAQQCLTIDWIDEVPSNFGSSVVHAFLISATQGAGFSENLVSHMRERLVLETDVELLGHWLALSIWNDPCSALVDVKTVMERLPTNEHQKIAWKWLSNWYSRNGKQSLLERKSWRDEDLPALTDLMAFSYKWVDPKDDPDGGGEVTLHKRAVDARNMIEGVALAHPGEMGHQNFMRVQRDKRFNSLTPWVGRLAWERLEQEAEPQKQSLVEFKSWLALMHPNTPVNAEQLQARVREELEELQDWLATSDRSPQCTWASVADELQMHRLIHVQLEHMAKGSYLVEAEAETVDGNPVDFRLSFANGQQCAIELKIAYGSFTKPRILGSMEAQLCKKYLLPSNRTVGFLLVVARADQPIKGKDFSVFETALWAEAHQCSQNYSRLIEPFVLNVKESKKAKAKS